MPVEKVLTSGEDTSVGEVQTYPIDVRPKVTHKEDVTNKAECNELRFSVEKHQEETKAKLGGHGMMSLFFFFAHA